MFLTCQKLKFFKYNLDMIDDFMHLDSSNSQKFQSHIANSLNAIKNLHEAGVKMKGLFKLR